MSNRRKLRTPAHVAAADQAFAYARDLAQQEPTTGVVVIEEANGEPCCWCFCEVGPDSPHNDPGYACTPCPNTADVLSHVLYGTPQHRLYPVCDAHKDDHLRLIAQLASTSQ